MRQSQFGFIQLDVAERMGIGPEAVSRIERGVVLPTLPRLYEFTELFDCKVAVVAVGSDRSSDLASALAKQMSMLHPDDRNFVLDMAGALCARLAQPGRRHKN